MSRKPGRTAKGACSSRTKRHNWLPRWWARGRDCWTVAPRRAARPQPSLRAILQPRLSRSSFIPIAPSCCERRVHAANVQVVTADILQFSPQGEFDRVLADVPCSGTGTLARNPEIKWRLKRQDLRDLHAKQVSILRAALRQLAPGGRCVYSTCSLEPEENQAVVDEVMAEIRGLRRGQIAVLNWSA